MIKGLFNSVVRPTNESSWSNSVNWIPCWPLEGTKPSNGTIVTVGLDLADVRVTSRMIGKDRFREVLG